MTSTSSRFIAAATSAERFAEVTGLLPHRGFTVHGGMACGLYPPSLAQVVTDRLTRAGIGHQATPAECWADGLRKLGMAAS